MSKEECTKLLKFIAMSVAGIFVTLLVLHLIQTKIIDIRRNTTTDDTIHELIEPGENFTDPVALDENFNIFYSFHVEQIDTSEFDRSITYVFTAGEDGEEIGSHTFDVNLKETEADVTFNFHADKKAIYFNGGTIGNKKCSGNINTRISYDSFPENLKISLTGKNLKISQLSLSHRLNFVVQQFVSAGGWILYVVLGYLMIALMFLAPAYFADDSFTDPVLYNFEATVLAIVAFLITSFLAVRFVPWLWSLINAFTERLYGYHLTLIENLVGESFWAIPILVVSIIAGIIMIYLQQSDVISEGRLYVFLAMLLGGFVRLLSIGFMVAVIISLLGTIIQMAIVIGFFALVAAMGSSGAGGGGSASQANEKYHFATRYFDTPSGYGNEYVLVSEGEMNAQPYAILHSSKGASIRVWPINQNSSDGLLMDDSRNTYYPR